MNKNARGATITEVCTTRAPATERGRAPWPGPAASDRTNVRRLLAFRSGFHLECHALIFFE